MIKDGLSSSVGQLVEWTDNEGIKGIAGVKVVALIYIELRRHREAFSSDFRVHIPNS